MTDYPTDERFEGQPAEDQLVAAFGAHADFVVGSPDAVPSVSSEPGS